MFKRLLSWFRLSNQHKSNPKPVIVPRASHCISRQQISAYALKVLYGLRKAGYQAYLVGGGIRDLLLQLHPKDFDVVTDARPEQVRALFRNCRLIGRRFRLAHIYFGSQFVEVATFRSCDTEDALHRVHSEEGMILRDNIYGTLEEDVFRRDFTINAVYYNIRDFSLIDYVGGLKDLELKCVRVIGDSTVRFREDPLRMLRAIRFAAKLDFKLSDDAISVIRAQGAWLQKVHPSRLLDEYHKLFLNGCGLKSFRLLRQYGLLAVLFPSLDNALNEMAHLQWSGFIEAVLEDTDTRFKAHRLSTLAFLLAAFLWGPLQLLQSDFETAAEAVLKAQQDHSALPKRLKQSILDIWYLQLRLTKKTTQQRVLRLRLHPKFRSAVDFLILRAHYSTDPQLKTCAQFWKTKIQEQSQ